MPADLIALEIGQPCTRPPFTRRYRHVLQSVAREEQPGTEYGEFQALSLESGAGEGNRTLVVSLEGFCSTIELHPQFNDLAAPQKSFYNLFYNKSRNYSPWHIRLRGVNGLSGLSCCAVSRPIAAIA